MLLAVLVVMIMPSLAERDARMNNVPGERKFLQQMREKRLELFIRHVISPPGTILTIKLRSEKNAEQWCLELFVYHIDFSSWDDFNK